MQVADCRDGFRRRRIRRADFRERSSNDDDFAAGDVVDDPLFGFAGHADRNQRSLDGGGIDQCRLRRVHHRRVVHVGVARHGHSDLGR